VSTVQEDKIEVIFPNYRLKEIISAMKRAHPYEEVAYDLISLVNMNPDSGCGWVGNLKASLTRSDFMNLLQQSFGCQVIRYSASGPENIQRVAVCGGSGSFLIPAARSVNADVLVTSDLKYNHFFEANNQFFLADIGHFESEIHFIEGLGAEIRKKSPKFAVHLSEVKKNPVQYWV
jgi:putative NIF3 family GTP cyclohydrolase 1 type 2